MNDIIAKISSYDLFTNLIPGAALVEFLAKCGVLDLKSGEILGDLLIYYLVGIVVSRIGAIIIEPILKWLRIITHGNYADFIKASAEDTKILVLLESSNLYRSLFTAALGGVVAISMAQPSMKLQENRWAILVTLAFLAVLFLLAHRKQNQFIQRRVDFHKENVGDPH